MSSVFSGIAAYVDPSAATSTNERLFGVEDMMVMMAMIAERGYSGHVNVAGMCWS